MDSRTAMPGVAAFVDQLRKAFGADYINAIMQRGIRGEPVFHAKENGFEIGTPLTEPKVVVSWDAKGISHVTKLEEGK